MNDMTIHGGNAVTMTSLELVEFINEQRKQDALYAGSTFPSKGFAKLEHADFLKKVPEVLKEHAGNFSCMFDVSIGNGATRKSPGFTFPKREACLMAMSYSYDLQAKVFDRMTELEARPIDPMKILSDPAAMRGLLLTYTEKVLSLESKVGELTPKAAALDLISASNDALTFTEAAKILDVKRKDLFLRLQTERWIYRRNGSWLGYDEHIKNGDLQYKEANFTNDDGMEVKKPYSHITPKGLTKLACMFSVELEAA